VGGTRPASPNCSTTMTRPHGHAGLVGVTVRGVRLEDDCIVDTQHPALASDAWKRAHRWSSGAVEVTHAHSDLLGSDIPGILHLVNYAALLSQSC
jgi:hypothetical protein